MSTRIDWNKANRRKEQKDQSAGQYIGEREARRRKREADRAGLEPTAKQLRYIAALSKQLGREPPDCQTRDGASAAINSLKRHIESATRASATTTAKGHSCSSLENAARAEA